MSKILVKNINQADDKIVLPVVKNEKIAVVLIGTESGEKEIIFELTGEGARAQILGLFVLTSGEVKVKTTQHHQAPNTSSDLLFKTILLGSAKFDYHGLIKIDNSAQNSDAYQKNDNLVIGSGTKVNTKPELEILADEVRCTHGATVGKLGEEQIYYLMTRGLSRDQAVGILLEGFLEEALERVDDEDKRQELKVIIKAELEKNLAV